MSNFDHSPMDSANHLYYLWAVHNLDTGGKDKIDNSDIRKEMSRLKHDTATGIGGKISALLDPVWHSTVEHLTQNLRDTGFIACKKYKDIVRNIDFEAIAPDEKRAFTDYSEGGYAHDIRLNDTGRIVLERLLKKNGIDPLAHLPPEKGIAR